MLYHLFLSVLNLITSILLFLCRISPNFKVAHFNAGFQIICRINGHVQC